jgi:hypothetical protein
MSLPILSSNAGIYSFFWEQEQLAIRVDRLSEDSKGVLTGEILIKTGMPGEQKHIHHTRINLTSGETRTRLAKTLTERVNHIDWYSILEQSCIMTLAKHREGEPIADLGDLPNYEAIRYRCSPILFDGEPTLIYGPGGTGKSYLGLYLACLIQYNYLGIYDWTPAAGNVLVLDWETSRQIYNRRAWAIKQGLGITDSTERIKYRYCTQPLPTDIAEIQKLVLENKINCVIVDSCGYAAGGDPNAAEVAIRYFNALRSLRVTSLTLDHVSKGLDGGKSPFGSVYKSNAARSVFQLKKSQDAGECVYDLGLYHEKVNEGMPLKPIGYKAAFSNNRDGVAIKVVFSASKVSDNPDLAKGLVLADRIVIFLLEYKTAEVKDIANGLEVDENTVKARLNENKKKFVHLKDGWALLSNVRQD